MSRQVLLFEGTDTANDDGLWVTNGTVAGTSELTGVSGARIAGLVPKDFTVLPDEGIVFAGADASNDTQLWVTRGTAASTSELTGISGASTGGLDPEDLATFGNEVLFDGQDTA